MKFIIVKVSIDEPCFNIPCFPVNCTTIFDMFCIRWVHGKIFFCCSMENRIFFSISIHCRVIVALAIERLVAIKFPLWSKYICSVLNARRILLLILLFAMVIQSYHFIVRGLDCSHSTLKLSKQNCRCKTLPQYARLEVILTIYLWRLILMTLLPLTIIITVNILIMNKLFNENSLVDHTNVTRNSRKKTILLYKISRMLVLLSSIYLLLHVPGSILDVLKVFFATAVRICNVKWQYYISLTHDIFDLLTNFNYGINFYLYIISGQHIRNELIYAFKHVKLTKPNDKIQRSSYFMSSYINLTKSPQCNRSNVQLSQQVSGTSI